MEERTCPVCGFQLLGRSDKRFCSDICRNTHNNKLRRDVNNYMRTINNILRKNRRILENLNPGGKTKIKREKLLNKGFSFEYYTHIYKTNTGNQYHFCYEQGYLAIEDDYFALVVKKEYVDN